MEYFIMCVNCGDELSLDITEEQYDRWYKRCYCGNERIQDVIPDVDVTTREMLITAICPKCWDKMFKSIDNL